MNDWNGYRTDLAKRFGELGEHNPDLMRGLGALNGSAVENGTLGLKVHELIALAVAVTTRCDGCIAFHTQKAADAGATQQEVAEALSTAIALNAGAALVYSARVLDAHAAAAGR